MRSNPSVGAVLFAFRFALRARWRSWVVIGIVAGITGGIVIAVAAGARRTDSAPTRVVVENRAADVLVNPNNGALTDAQWRALERLPGVADWAQVAGVVMLPFLPNGQPDLPFLESANSTLVIIKSVDLHALPENIFTKAWLESKRR